MSTISTTRKIVRKYRTKSGDIRTYEYPDDSILVSEMTYADRDKFRNNLKNFINEHKDILLNINSRKINKFIRDSLGNEYNIHYVNLYIRKIREKLKKIKENALNNNFTSIIRKFNELTNEEQEKLMSIMNEIIKFNQSKTDEINIDEIIKE